MLGSEESEDALKKLYWLQTSRLMVRLTETSTLETIVSSLTAPSEHMESRVYVTLSKIPFSAEVTPATSIWTFFSSNSDISEMTSQEEKPMATREKLANSKAPPRFQAF